MNWDDLKVFLEVARSERLHQAAKRLNMDASTVSRRIHKLESQLAVHLFQRTNDGHMLTLDGEKLIDAARKMEQNAQLALDNIATNTNENAGNVRIGVTEAFGNVFIAEKLAALVKYAPNIQVDLLSFSRDIKISRNEAEIAIAVERPKSTSMIVSKLTDYSLALYAKKSHPAAKLTEQQSHQLKHYAWVGYVDNLLFTEQLSYFKQVAGDITPSFRSTSIIGQYHAIKSGLGIGILPCFLADQDETLVRIMPDQINLIRTFWLVTHPEIKRLARVNTVWQFLKTLTASHQSMLIPTT